MIPAIQTALPGLVESLSQHVYINDAERLWADLSRLLRANAPSGGVWLPGAIADDLAAVVEGLGLSDRFSAQLGRTGNATLWFGADKPQADVIVVAHLDRPTFRVKDAVKGELYPMCAIRVPGEGYSAQAKALRFTDGRVAVSAVGNLRFAKVGGQDQITFLSDGGQLTWYDSITMETEPLLRGGLISGTGLDNCIGCVVALGAAWALAKVDAFLRAAGRRVLFVFSDLEEGIPDAYFGHGAARLAGAMPPPTFGAIVVDGQNVGAPGNPALWNGGSFGTVSGWSRGSFVAPNYCALGADLVQAVNLRWPNTAQVNTGYLSRSDDVPLGRWTQLLGMFGPPLVNAHTTEENAALSDLQGCMRLLALYLGVVSATPPELDSQYALTR